MAGRRMPGGFGGTTMQMQPALRRPASELGTAGSILVVDDDAERIDLVRRTLEAAGYAVRVTGSAAQADAIAATWRPAAVLLGARVPTPMGLAGIPTVLLGDVRAEAQGLDRASAPLCSDPVDRADLLATVWVATNP